MDPLDLTRLLLRWAHSLAAVAWLGGGLFYLLTRADAGPATLRELFRVAVAIFLATGAILTFDRLTQPHLPSLYPPLLGLKIALSLALFAFIASQPPRQHGASSAQSAWSSRPMVLALATGALIYLLAIALKLLYEQGLAEASYQPSVLSFQSWFVSSCCR
ncbi:MAG: hypothetical protein HYY05_05160 [Chloroflexi bacterium]|nr:hypothetical protein [Chloroflexota bacterium]